MNEVAERRHLDASGIVGENRYTSWRAVSAHYPVVAPLRGDLTRGDLARLHTGHQIAIRLHDLQGRESAGDERVSVSGSHRLEDVLGEDADVEAIGKLEIIPGVGSEASVCFLDAIPRDVHRELNLVDCMSSHTWDGERGPAEDDRFGGPGIRDNPCELELHREGVTVLLDIRVHTVRMCGKEALGVRMIARPLRLVPRPSEHHQAGPPVVVERVRAKDLGKPSFMPAAPHLHLPEPILRHHIALREEEVVVVLRVDVRYPPLVPDDLDWLP